METNNLTIEEIMFDLTSNKHRELLQSDNGVAQSVKQDWYKAFHTLTALMQNKPQINHLCGTIKQTEEQKKELADYFNLQRILKLELITIISNL